MLTAEEMEDVEVHIDGFESKHVKKDRNNVKNYLGVYMCSSTHIRKTPFMNTGGLKDLDKLKLEYKGDSNVPFVFLRSESTSLKAAKRLRKAL